MDKYKVAEVWETQMILYLILAQLVETDWIMWALRIYALFVFLSIKILKYKSKVKIFE